MDDKDVQSGILRRFLAPALLAVACLPLVLALILANSFREIAFKHREKMLQNLVDTTWDMLDYQASLAAKGTVSEKEVKRRALENIRRIRYGKDRRSYFWVIDKNGVVLAHPYRPDLEGANGLDLVDADGKKIILDFIKVATQKGRGFVRYKWQWNDDPNRIERKIAAVRFFAPWGWVIGTGAYVNDIEEEALSISWKIIAFGGGVFLFLLGLSIRSFRQARRFERERRSDFEKLSKTEAKIRALVDSIPDMILRVKRDGRVVDYKEPLNFVPFFDPGEMLNNKIAEVWPEDIADKAMEALGKSFESGCAETITFRASMRTVDGGMMVEGVFVASENDEALAVFREVTRRREGKS